jgi:hypothetical protein
MCLFSKTSYAIFAGDYPDFLAGDHLVFHAQTKKWVFLPLKEEYFSKQKKIILF